MPPTPKEGAEQQHDAAHGHARERDRPRLGILDGSRTLQPPRKPWTPRKGRNRGKYCGQDPYGPWSGQGPHHAFGHHVTHLSPKVLVRAVNGAVGHPQWQGVVCHHAQDGRVLDALHDCQHVAVPQDILRRLHSRLSPIVLLTACAPLHHVPIPCDLRGSYLVPQVEAHDHAVVFWSAVPLGDVPDVGKPDVSRESSVPPEAVVVMVSATPAKIAVVVVDDDGKPCPDASQDNLVEDLQCREALEARVHPLGLRAGVVPNPERVNVGDVQRLQRIDHAYAIEADVCQGPGKVIWSTHVEPRRNSFP
mmetsp:Transcript_4396/g.8900  ORF Transcript_4396/g.8900 Transcript_4396/m.8900 type:complete len:306 (-) Transcript_4396:172-1089(-)